MIRPTRTLGPALLLAAVACDAGDASAGAATPAAHDARDAAPPVEWPAYGGTPDGAHFSPLADISRANVRALRVAWIHRSGDVSDGREGRVGTNSEATPIVVDGTLFTVTPFSRVLALDPETGAERWAFDPHVDRTVATHDALTSRGVSTWLDSSRAPDARCRRRIFVATFDARLFALDARSGAPCADFGVRGEVDLRTGVRNVSVERTEYHESSAPAVARDVVIVGSAISDNRRVEAASGVVRAFDARTGALRWAWEPLLDLARPRGRDARDSRSGRAMGDSTAFRASAANAWATISVDAERDLAFVPTGSASPDHFGGLRPGPNLYANSIVALRAATGRVAWHFQLVHHDLWDYDASSQPALFTMRRDGRAIPAVAMGSKMGSLFFFERETGAPLFPIEERPVPVSDVPEERAWPTQPFPTRPPPLVPQRLRAEDAWGLTWLDRAACRRRIAALRNDGIFTPPSVRGSIEFPGFIGGMNWGGVAVDETRGVVVANTSRVAGVVTLVPRALHTPSDSGDYRTAYITRAEGTPYAIRRSLLVSPLGAPCNPPPWGALTAVRAATGDVLWEVPLGNVRDLTRVPTPARWASPTLGGPLATAGGLVFIASTMDHTLRAFDVDTGREVWSAALPASAQATPMTYRARAGGKQFIVIAAGGHKEMGTKLGDYLIAFALP